MKRTEQMILIASFVPACWLGMMLVHELGHVAGAWLTGGTITRLVVHPLTISRTDVMPNPYPLAVVWAGPIIGVGLPLMAWAIAARCQARGVFLALLRFFAGFCSVANGAYIAAGSLGRVGDAGKMLTHGSPAWTLIAFGVITVAVGFFLWHRQGEHFGMGSADGKVDSWAAYTSLVLFAVMLILGFTFSPRS